MRREVHKDTKQKEYLVRIALSKGNVMGGKATSTVNRFKQNEVVPVLNEMFEIFASKNQCCSAYYVVGSIRRERETVGDVDLVLLVDSLSQEKLLATVLSMYSVENWNEKRVQAVFTRPVDSKRRVQVDVYVCRDRSYLGCQIMSWTGPAKHNVAMRNWAIGMGMKLSQNGLYKNHELIGGSTEEEVFDLLKLPFIRPMARDDYGSAAKLHVLSNKFYVAIKKSG